MCGDDCSAVLKPTDDGDGDGDESCSHRRFALSREFLQMVMEEIEEAWIDWLLLELILAPLETSFLTIQMPYYIITLAFVAIVGDGA